MQKSENSVYAGKTCQKQLFPGSLKLVASVKSEETTQKTDKTLITI